MNPGGSPWKIYVSDTDHFDNPTRQIQGIHMQRSGEENNNNKYCSDHVSVHILYQRHLQGEFFKFWKFLRYFLYVLQCMEKNLGVLGDTTYLCGRIQGKSVCGRG